MKNTRSLKIAICISPASDLIPARSVGRSPLDKEPLYVTGPITDAFRVLRAYVQSILVDIGSTF